MVFKFHPIANIREIPPVSRHSVGAAGAPAARRAQGDTPEKHAENPEI
jgi:hypothetical protein